MKKYIKKCPVCGTYTLKDACPNCGNATKTAHPPPFSLEDKYMELKIKGAHNVIKNKKSY